MRIIRAAWAERTRNRAAHPHRVSSHLARLGIVVVGALAACSSKSTNSAGLSSPPSGDDLADSAIQPAFGPTVVATDPPPPLSGGTLLATRDGTHAIAADPERDSVYVVDLKTRAVDFTVNLSAGDEPGRLVEDGAGRIHVALRKGGALVTIDPTNGTILERRSVCPAPRGVAWDSATDLVWVACATGELVALPAAGGAATQALTLERDLRDVIVEQGGLAVTEFRSAEVLRVSSDGTITRRDQLPSPQSGFTPHVAWRTVAGPDGSLVAVHQASSTANVTTTVQGGYGGGGGCFAGGAPVTGTLPSSAPSGGFISVPGTFASPFPDAGLTAATLDGSTQNSTSDAEAELGSDGGQASSDAMMPNEAEDAGAPVAATPTCIPLPDGGASGFLPTPTGFFSTGPSSSIDGCLPSGIVLDVLTAMGPDGSVIFSTTFPGVLPVDVAVSADGSSIAAIAPGNAFTSGLDTVFAFSSCGSALESSAMSVNEQPIAVAFNGSGTLLVQTRQPAALQIYGRGTAPIAITLSRVSREDTGQDIFHTQAGGMIACASCHPEGRDDGHVWLLDGSERRTPSLLGTIAGTAPYHWPGDEANLDVLVNDVYTIRMNGVMLPDDERDALTGWAQTFPPPPPPASAASSAAQRGQALFERPDVGCYSCHSGSKFTNNQTVDVGTGGAFQVPPLVGVGWRTPLMHDGCATTLADRFGKCATSGHGNLSTLAPSDISDLVAYLQTL